MKLKDNEFFNDLYSAIDKKDNLTVSQRKEIIALIESKLVPIYKTLYKHEKDIRALKEDRGIEISPAEYKGTIFEHMYN